MANEENTHNENNQEIPGYGVPAMQGSSSSPEVAMSEHRDRHYTTVRLVIIALILIATVVILALFFGDDGSQGLELDSPTSSEEMTPEQMFVESYEENKSDPFRVEDLRMRRYQEEQASL